MQKYNKYKTQYQKHQQTIKSSDKIYTKSSQDNFVDENEYKSLCNIFTKYLDETKDDSFLYTYIKNYFFL